MITGLLLLAIILIAALAPRYGADSRDLSGGTDYYPAHPDRRDTWTSTYPR